MTTASFNFECETVHASWLPCITAGLSCMNPVYLDTLLQNQDWLPGKDKIFNAFSVPIHQVNYILFGESPYPRIASANGYAFWDAAIEDIWSPTGFNKKVNRATSLRNILKMLLVAQGLLPANQLSQQNIADLNKKTFVQSGNEFFTNLLNHGFLLLNATPVLRTGDFSRQKEANEWILFLKNIIDCLIKEQRKLTFILLGQIANKINPLIPDSPHIKKICAEHPYNLSFINNSIILDFFKPLNLLIK
jgi:uracil-DNA glycosylase